MGVQRGLRRGDGVEEQPRLRSHRLARNTIAYNDFSSTELGKKPVIPNVPFQVKRINTANRIVSFPVDVKENSFLQVTQTSPIPKRVSYPAYSEIMRRNISTKPKVSAPQVSPASDRIILKARPPVPLGVVQESPILSGLETKALITLSINFATMDRGVHLLTTGLENPESNVKKENFCIGEGR
ncbi:hypothetical protein NPIL_47261 [Nephila pilipes]|uniref:Uncharacterized protein n=1 Tax=Nephila pilipes TaxID=299642 RepID=A0A8X6TMN0_NEPPI|nr:hypothetical protein NPIL_47261 [Nephila pilipes]